MPEVTLVVKFEVQPDKLEQYLALMKVLITETRKEKGCLRYELQTVEGEPN